jgi:HSP20 family protein
MDSIDKADKIIVRVDVPGVKKEDVKVTLHHEGDHYVLIVSGERHDEFKSESGQETRYGKFTRSVALPKNIKVDGLTAKHELGTLMITVPKVELPAASAPINVNVH